MEDITRNRIMVTLAGKYSGPYFEKIKSLKRELIDNGIDVLYPKEGDMSDDPFGFFESDIRTGDDKKDFWYAEKHFVNDTNSKCDAIIICNYDGYIGKMTSNELYAFASFIASDYDYDPNHNNSYYTDLRGYIPIYLLENINVEKFRTGEIGDFAELLEYGIEKDLIRVGLNRFYADYNSGQLTKLKKRF